MRARRIVPICIALAVVLGVAAVLLVPVHPESGALALVGRVLPHGALTGGSPLWWTFESLGNIALFVPVGALAAVVLGPRRGLVVAVLLSAACELAQGWIPLRHASLSDVVLNASGAAIGAAAVALVRRAAAGRPGRRQARRA